MNLAVQQISIFQGRLIKKMNTYGPLLRNLQILYLEYKFQMMPIVVGPFGYVLKCLTQYLSQLGFNNIEIKENNLKNAKY